MEGNEPGLRQAIGPALKRQLDHFGLTLEPFAQIQEETRDKKHGRQSPPKDDVIQQEDKNMTTGQQVESGNGSKRSEHVGPADRVADSLDRIEAQGKRDIVTVSFSVGQTALGVALGVGLAAGVKALAVWAFGSKTGAVTAKK